MNKFLVPLLLLNLLPTASVAQPEKPEVIARPGDKGPRQGRGPWKDADLNKDGRISREEFAMMPRIKDLPADKIAPLFARLDRNGDGSLEGDELSRPGRGRGPNRLKELDADGSGSVSFEEFEQGKFFKKLPAEKRREIFDRMDTNKDGHISPLDRPNPPHRRKGPRPKPPGESLKQQDSNKDGKISFEEFQKDPIAQNLSEDEQEDRFEAADRNGDGFLTGADFRPPNQTEKR